jgi:ribosomal protein S18 acetylase RimI-like enzyme
LVLTVGPVRDEERAKAFDLFFGAIPCDDRAPHVDRGLELLAAGEIGGEGVIVCRDGSRLVGVMIAIPLAGACALVWPVRTIDGPARVLIQDMLVDGILAWLRARRCKLAQALLSPEDDEGALPLERWGFKRITHLHFLQVDLSARRDMDSATSRLTSQNYTRCDRALFRNTLLRSYDRTLDCPELDNVRTPEEVLAGYAAVPGSRPDRWWLAWHHEQPAGVLIVTETQGLPSWELLYVGLVPELRGRGLGTELTCLGIREARAAGAERMTLTVDARNAPAWRMYRVLGFEEFDRRLVLLNLFQGAAARDQREQPPVA